MGFAVSYVAFNSAPKREVLAVARLRETGPVQDFDSCYKVAELPRGWTLLFVDNELYASDDRLAALSANHAVLGCQVEEDSIWSTASFYIRAEQIWRVAHDNEKGDFDLDIRGVLPPEFRAIRAAQEQKQRRADPKFAVSYIFDIPVQLVESICGFRYDRSRFWWGQPIFYSAVPAS